MAKDIELDAVVASSNPTLTTGCVCMLVAPLWCDLGCFSRTVVVIKSCSGPPPLAMLQWYNLIIFNLTICTSPNTFLLDGDVESSVG